MGLLQVTVVWKDYQLHRLLRFAFGCTKEECSISDIMTWELMDFFIIITFPPLKWQPTGSKILIFWVNMDQEATIKILLNCFLKLTLSFSNHYVKIVTVHDFSLASWHYSELFSVQTLISATSTLFYATLKTNLKLQPYCWKKPAWNS